jgi:hypothetical protein
LFIEIGGNFGHAVLAIYVCFELERLHFCI